MIKVTYETTKDDFKQFNFFILKRRVFRKVMLLPLLIWIIGIIFFAIIIFPKYYLIFRDGVIFGCGLFLVTLPLIIIGAAYLLTAFSANYNYDRFPLQHAIKTIGFDSDGVHVLGTAINKNPETLVPWLYIQEIVKTPAYIYVLQSKSVAYPIPTRVFASLEQANNVFKELERLLQQGHCQPREIKESVIIDDIDATNQGK